MTSFLILIAMCSADPNMPKPDNNQMHEFVLFKEKAREEFKQMKNKQLQDSKDPALLHILTP